MGNTRIASDTQLLAGNLGQLPEPMAEPRFIMVSGLPGAGKSYFCKKLVERLPFLILESDALRETLFSPPTYSLAERSRLFRSLHHLIEGLLKQRIPLVLDATNLSERYRERLYNIADRLNVKLIVVRIEAPPNLVYKRLKARTEERKPKVNSDADWAVYQKMMPNMQKIHRNHYAMDTSRDITPVLDKIVMAVNK